MFSLWEWRRCVTASKTNREVVRPVKTVMGTPCAATAWPSKSNGPMCAVAMMTPWFRAFASRRTAIFVGDNGTSAISSSGVRCRNRSSSPKLRADMRKMSRAIVSSRGLEVSGPMI